MTKSLSRLRPVALALGALVLGTTALSTAAGAEVLLDDAVVGRVTSVGLHWELGPIALAVIKRNVDPAA